MTAVESLTALKQFVEEEIASTFLLQKEGSPMDNPEYVNPYVALFTLPHKNFVPVNFQVPHILIGMSQGIDGAEDHPLSIQMQFAIYGGNIIFPETANLPDSSGYIDLLNVIERTKEKLVQAAVIKKCGVVNKPFLYGVYTEQITYPYWYGYLTFDLQIESTIRQYKEFL